jgi:polyadenylate-binding protein
VTNKLKYFDIDGKQCRGLAYNPSLLGSNRLLFNKTHTNFIVFKNKQKAFYSKDLDEIFSKEGEVLSARSAIKEDHTPLGYGFVTFKDSNSAESAITKYNPDSNNDLIAVPFNPREKKDASAIGTNNIYVKDFPDTWNEQKLTEVFTKYGHIKSLLLRR